MPGCGRLAGIMGRHAGEPRNTSNGTGPAPGPRAAPAAPAASGATSPSSSSTPSSAPASTCCSSPSASTSTCPAHYWDEIRVFLPVACVVSVGVQRGLRGLRPHLAPRQHRRSPPPRRRRRALRHDPHRRRSCGARTASRSRVLIAGPFIVTFLYGMVRFQSRLFAYKRNTFKGGGVRVAVVGGGQAGAAAIREMQQTAVAWAWCPRSSSTTTVAALAHDPRRADRRRDRRSPRRDRRPRDQPGPPRHHRRADAELVQPHRRDRRRGRHPRAGAAAAVVVGARHAAPDRHPRPRHRRPRRPPSGGDRHRADAGAAARQAGAHHRWRRLDRLRDRPAGRRLRPRRSSCCSTTTRPTSTTRCRALAGAAEVALSDIRDREVLERCSQRVRPEVVFHAAAHKHVPILEDYVCEAVRTNVFGTINVLDAVPEGAARRTWCASPPTRPPRPTR